MQKPHHQKSASGSRSLPIGWKNAPQRNHLCGPYQLGEGESAAIQLAKELKADLLVMDERAGREEALKRGLPVIGTLGILERESERGLLDFAITFTELKARNFFVSPALARDFLERDAQRKKGTDY